MKHTIRDNQGFTLIELLVVIAISIILMALVIAPVVQTFSMTRQAQSMIDTQDSARQAMEQISRELGEAMFVFNNSVAPVSIYDDATTPPYLLANNEGPIQLPVRQPGGTIKCFTIPNGKIDMILPKMIMHCNNPAHPAGSPRDFERGMEAQPPCPVCTSTDVEARPKLPLEQDVTIVRYFLGLRFNDPTKTDINNLKPGEGLFGWKSPYGSEIEPGEENQVVLYRVEFKPDDETLFPAKGSPSTAEYQQRNLNDPIFFYRSANNSNGVPCCVEWAKRARVVGIGKYQDLVKAESNSSGIVTSIDPSITFSFAKLNNDTLSAPDANGGSFEYPDAAPSVCDAKYGYWIGSDYRITMYRNDNTTAYITELSGGDLMIIKRDYIGGSWSAPLPTFNISQYLKDGTISAGSNGTVDMAFTIDENRGRVDFALKPPRPDGQRWATVFDADKITSINDIFNNKYVTDRGSAIRSALLSTFDKATGFLLPNARVVPGSEKVIGPNMMPGATVTKLVSYERVPLELGDPGLNQYKINYDTGTIYFSSVYDQNIPTNKGCEMDIDYKICFNKPEDIVKADYTTKSLVTVHLGMRMFDPESGKDHTVDLNNSVKVGNAFR